MARVFLCENEHAWLPEAWELGRAECFPASCIACGATVRLQEEVVPADHRTSVVPAGYEILSALEGATMAEMYKARHRGSRRLVALKISLLDPEATPSERVTTRREARLLGMLEHPNIVRIVQTGSIAGRAFIALEWLGGGTLAERFCDGPMPPGRAARIFAKLSEAIHHAHGSGVLHLDLRPTNVVFSGRDQPKLVDFGLAARLDRRTGRARGTAMGGDPRYMAPEQASDERGVVGPAADIHALGALLYQAVAGRLPFGGICLDQRLASGRVEILPLAGFQPHVPAALDLICSRCLEPAPENRYQTAAELAFELRRISHPR